MSLSAEAVVRIFESRFDWYSARIVLRAAAEQSSVSADGPFDATVLGKLADALPKLSDHVEALVAAVRSAADAQTSPPVKAHVPAPVPARVEAPPAPVETSAAEAAPEAAPEAAAEATAEHESADGRKDGKKKK